VKGETKGDQHGVGGGAEGPAVPLRRWEDWERSRLRKLKREERRRRDFERAHPSGYIAGEGDLLSTRFDVRSQYDGSDTLSLASSEEDQWGTQIGGYNEHNAKYPPPPVGLHIATDALESAETVGGAELEAMLEAGFDDGHSPPTSTNNTTRYTLTDVPTAQLHRGYAPVSTTTSPGYYHPDTALSPTSPHTNMSARGRGPAVRGRPSRTQQPQYGPLGPLDPGTRF
jgi:chitin synthase